MSCLLGHNAPESRVEHVKHRREGDGQTGVQRLHQQCRDRIVQVGAQRPGRHPPGGGRGAARQGDNDGIIIYFKQYASFLSRDNTVCPTHTGK